MRIDGGAVVYLTTTFLVAKAGAWFASHFGFVRSLSDRYAMWKSKRRGARDEEEFDEAFASKREIAAAKARKAETSEEEKAAGNGSLLSSFFGWFGRRKRARATREARGPCRGGVERGAGFGVADDASHAGGCCTGDGAACGGGGGGSLCGAVGGGGGSVEE